MIKGLVASMSLTLILVFGLLFALLAGLSYYFNLGIIATVGMAVGLGLIQWAIGPSIVRWSTNMSPLNKEEFPWIEETTHGICNKNNVKIPKITIANTSMPNAFVFGRTSKSATLTLTRGLLDTLTKDEVKGVIAHEIGHIKHNDMVVMTIISVIPTIAYFIALSTMFGGRGRNQGGSTVIIGIGAFVVYFITNLLILYFSRLREFYADNFAGQQVKPTILANALAKITYGLSLQKQEARNSTLRSFYAVDPISSSYEVTKFASYYKDQHVSEDEVKKAMDWERNSSFSKFGEIFRTHPLTYKRINKLYQMEKELS
ncbi:MAG: zinc metalloprotease HtpX [Nitrosopumilus sp.]|nr:zinc metalloprotease HtpX [Nitrosopumilus sp.]MDH3489800.1 zinc metalloprotease HtpX [Nitrosopumilus sp.]MDH3516623.1 zinc metalloprotease HtpX [Nitrosopumilus sp.]MDH3564631.1 zinc metalloprotease HtpX [Nitrosopumilus sp.]MDH5416842.1 zinc metalloprotease HtpX [Nitrosopumilus sp.]